MKMNCKSLVSFTLGLIFVLVLHGALPFLAMPTLGQALWTTGFSQSFVNESIFSIYAKNFGAPEPAAISFGLAGAYPTGLFIAAGLHSADAYAAMAALWLALAFWGAWRIGSMFGLSAPFAALCAVLWMSMPVVWAHAVLCMVSLGFGLLPLYFGAALQLFSRQLVNRTDAIRSAVLYLAVCIIAVFMDGYSYMMFAVGSTLLAVYVYVRFAELRRHVLVFALPLHVVGFTVAYGLYAAYLGKLQFPPDPLDFFRGWGIDLSFLVVPTKGMHWIFDALGLSLPRTSDEYFGDYMVWNTSFSLPLITLGFFAWLRVCHRSRFANGFLLIALFGLYLSMGPSIKLNSIKSEEVKSSAEIVRSMPAELALAPTGSAWLSENVPGFKNMRASYRWLALGSLGFWFLVVLLLSDAEARGKRSWLSSVISLLIILNLPHPVEKIKESFAYRNNFFEIDDILLNELRESLKPGEKVAFLPYENDFLINYLAARTNIRTYNIGGDKNLASAMKHWPLTMRNFLMEKVDAGFADKVLLFLARGEGDAVVLPYFDTLRAAYRWPYNPQLKEASFYRGSVLREALSTTVRILKHSPYLNVDERDHYAVIRIAPDFISRAEAQKLEGIIVRSKVDYPIRLTAESPHPAWVLSDGWHETEIAHVWSSQHAVLDLPVPESCSESENECFAGVKFRVFGASEQHPVEVKFESMDAAANWSAVVSASRPDDHEVLIPLPKDEAKRRIVIDVPDASSPALLTGGPDGRVLGIDLSVIELRSP
jgi:hypothetical protein